MFSQQACKKREVGVGEATSHLHRYELPARSEVGADRGTDGPPELVRGGATSNLIPKLRVFATNR